MPKAREFHGFERRPPAKLVRLPRQGIKPRIRRRIRLRVEYDDSGKEFVELELAIGLQGGFEEGWPTKEAPEDSPADPADKAGVSPGQRRPAMAELPGGAGDAQAG